MDGQNWQQQVCVGDGWSYGVQFLVQRKIGKLAAISDRVIELKDGKIVES